MLECFVRVLLKILAYGFLVAIFVGTLMEVYRGAIQYMEDRSYDKRNPPNAPKGLTKKERRRIEKAIDDAYKRIR